MGAAIAEAVEWSKRFLGVLFGEGEVGCGRCSVG
jgi:hypothetical protein